MKYIGGQRRFYTIQVLIWAKQGLTSFCRTVMLQYFCIYVNADLIYYSRIDLQCLRNMKMDLFWCRQHIGPFGWRCEHIG